MFQTVIVEELPKSSTSMSLLALYISTLVGITAMGPKGPEGDVKRAGSCGRSTG